MDISLLTYALVLNQTCHQPVSQNKPRKRNWKAENAKTPWPLFLTDDLTLYVTELLRLPLWGVMLP